jgi:hypothetical protein
MLSSGDRKSDGVNLAGYRHMIQRIFGAELLLIKDLLRDYQELLIRSVKLLLFVFSIFGLWHIC